MYDKVDERKGNTKRKRTITAQLVPNHLADFGQGGGMLDIPLSAPLWMWLGFLLVYDLDQLA